MRVNALNMPTDTDKWSLDDWRYFAGKLAREYEIVVRELLKDRPDMGISRFPRLAEAERVGLL